MDAKDYAIYRYLSPDGFARFWASRRLIDPRVTAREIAERVGLSEAGVRSRLRSLKEGGLLRGSSVGINPSLFDAPVSVVEVPIRTPKESDQLFHDLPLAEGLLFARDVLDEEDRKVSVYLAAESDVALARRVGLVRRLAPSREIRGPRPYWIPPCSRGPTPLDWKLLAAFRRRPDSTVAEIANDAGVGVKTTARRFDLLLEAHACWWSHSPESQEWPLALLLVDIDPGAEPLATAAKVAARSPGWIPVAPDGFGVEPGPARTASSQRSAKASMSPSG